MQAWDITIETRSSQDACDIMHPVAVELAYFNPLPGYSFSFSHFEDYLAPLFEFSHSDAIVALKQNGYVVWSYFLSTNMAIIDWKGKTDDGEKLDQAVQVCLAHNKEQTKRYKETGQQGSFIDRIVLSQRMIAVPSIRERMQDPKDRVFWDKYNQIGSKQEGRDIIDSKSIDALNDKEVVVTLQNFP
jgi:hypothetical protein